MRTTTTIEGVSLENLVDLFTTATYGSSWLDIFAPVRTGLHIEETDCREDVWAKALLAGHSIECIDYYAEEEAYGNLPHTTDEDGNVTYIVTLEDIMKGLQACFDGTFKGDDNAKSWLKECFYHFADKGSMELDQPEAEALMQVIMFNELIYG